MTAKYPPEGAITNIKDLEVIIILGLPVVIWDIDPATIKPFHPLQIVKGHKGLFILFKEGISLYAKWLGFEDPSYNATEVLWSMPDDQINKAEAKKASLYMFNTDEEAKAAFTQWKLEEAARRNEWLKQYNLMLKA